MSRPVSIVVAAALVAACSSGPRGGDTLVVFAASSLNDVFTALATDSESGVSADFSFAGSSTLATQIVNGAPANVFASADERQMEVVISASTNAGAPVVFATNSLVLAVERGNPRGVHALADIDEPGLLVALAAQQVPLGQYSREMLASAQVEVTPVTLEPDARSVLAKVEMGEVDVGIVYRTDAMSSDEVDFIDLDESRMLSIDYYVVALDRSDDEAQAFIDRLVGTDGQQVLLNAGFGLP